MPTATHGRHGRLRRTRRRDAVINRVLRLLGVREAVGGQEQLEALRRIGKAEPYPGGPARVIDLTATEAAHRSEAVNGSGSLHGTAR